MCPPKYLLKIYRLMHLLANFSIDKLSFIAWLSICWKEVQDLQFLFENCMYTGAITADVNDPSRRRAAAPPVRHTSSALWVWSASRPTLASSSTAGLPLRVNETHCREAAADPHDTTSNPGAGLPEVCSLSERSPLWSRVDFGGTRSFSLRESSSLSSLVDFDPLPYIPYLTNVL